MTFRSGRLRLRRSPVFRAWAITCFMAASDGSLIIISVGIMCSTNVFVAWSITSAWTWENAADCQSTETTLSSNLSRHPSN